MRPIILLTFVVWVAGCGGGSPGGAEGDPSRWVVAAIDTEPISAVDLNSAVVRLAHGVDTLSADALRSQALDLLVEQRLLVAEAELRGFSRDSLVLEKLEDVARNRLHKAYWKGVKADNALSAGDIREYFADTVVAVRGPTIMVRDYKIGSRLRRRLGVGESFADVARRAPVEPGAKYAQGESRLFAWSDVGVHAMQNVIFRHSAGDIVGPLHVGRGQVMLVQLDTLYRGPEAVERHFVKLSRWLKRRHQTQVMRRARRELFDSYGVSINSQAISRLARDYPKRTMRWLRRAPGGAGDLHLALTAAGPLTAKKMGQLALTLPRRLRSTLDDKDAVAQAARYLAVEFLCSIAEARRLGIHRRPLEVEAFTSRQHRFMVERLVSEAVDGVAQKPTDEEIAQAVEEHGDRLLTLGKVTVREILLPTQKAAVDIKRRIARGESFGALADIYSLRLRYGERPKGGMVMLTSADQKPSVAIVQAAFDAKLRRVTGPITTDDGVSLLYVERREAPTRMDAKSGRATIVESLVRNLVNQRYTEFTDSLRSEADLIVFDSALKLVDIGR